MEGLARLDANVLSFLLFLVIIAHSTNVCLSQEVFRTPQAVPSNHRMSFNDLYESSQARSSSEPETRLAGNLETFLEPSSIVIPSRSSIKDDQTSSRPTAKWSIMYHDQGEPNYTSAIQSVHVRADRLAPSQISFDDERQQGTSIIYKREKADSDALESQQPVISLTEAQRALQENLALQGKLLSLLNKTRLDQASEPSKRRHRLVPRIKSTGSFQLSSLVPTNNVVRHPHLTHPSSSGTSRQASNLPVSTIIRPPHLGINYPTINQHNPQASVKFEDQPDSSAARIDLTRYASPRFPSSRVRDTAESRLPDADQLDEFYGRQKMVQPIPEEGEEVNEHSWFLDENELAFPDDNLNQATFYDLSGRNYPLTRPLSDALRNPSDDLWMPSASVGRSLVKTQPHRSGSHQRQPNSRAQAANSDGRLQQIHHHRDRDPMIEKSFYGGSVYREPITSATYWHDSRSGDELAAAHQIVHIHSKEKKGHGKYIWPIVGAGLTMLMGFLIISNILLSIPLLAIGASSLFNQGGGGWHSQQLVPIYNLSQFTTRLPGRRRRKKRSTSSMVLNGGRFSLPFVQVDLRRPAAAGAATALRALPVLTTMATTTTTTTTKPTPIIFPMGKNESGLSSSVWRGELDRRLERIVDGLIEARAGASKFLTSWNRRQMLKAAYCFGPMRIKQQLVMAADG